MAKFAFIIHPIDVNDMARKFPFMNKLPKGVVHGITKIIPPLKVSEIKGVESNYSKTEGWFIGCTLTTEQMTMLNPQYVMKKIIKSGKLAEKLGANIVGLGAHTSVVGDAGITVAKNLGIAVTTGNSYTISTAMEGTLKAAKKMGISVKDAEVTILGANGSIGRVCAQMMAKKCRYLNLVSRDISKLEGVAEQLIRETGVSCNVSNNIKSTLKKSDIIITVTSAIDTIINPEDLKSGAVVCDVARPRDVSKKVAEVRDDVLVIEGGIVEVPGDVDFGFNFGFPPKTSYACMAETMILALENRIENFSIGRELNIDKVEEITALAEKHGFRLAGFRSFEREISEETIAQIAQKANLAKGKNTA